MKSFLIEIKWAFLFILSILIWMVLERLFGLHDEHIYLHQYITMLYSIVAISVYFLALRNKREDYYNGKITYLQSFISGLIITGIITLFTPITQWIILEIITPDFFENMIQYSFDKGMYESKAAAEYYFNYKNYVIQSVIGALILGVVTTAIVSIFIKKK
mgnify:CR=1 FL=1